jgi:hypothetical protein
MLETGSNTELNADTLIVYISVESALSKRLIEVHSQAQSTANIARNQLLLLSPLTHRNICSRVSQTVFAERVADNRALLSLLSHFT